ncbi:hypothetical protein ACILE2_07195 [Capnocytophaga canimorsus]|uniref:Ig-like domain-containing protein n=1 Tax=Capnocytophaga canimorsus TaxID=28188 RepID=UPI0037D886EF
MKKIILLFLCVAITTISCDKKEEQQPAKVQVDPEKLIFEPLEIEQTSKRELSIKNVGQQDLIISSITLEGEDSDNFSVENVKKTVSVGETLSVEVIFISKNIGDKNAVLVLNSNVGKTQIPIEAKSVAKPTPKIIITTDQISDKTEYYETKFPIEELQNVWVDFNDNGVKDKEEEEILSRLSISVKRGVLPVKFLSKKVTIYGKISHFNTNLGEERINSIDISSNPHLTHLSCNGEKINNLKLNTQLQELICASTNVVSVDLTKNENLKELHLNYNTMLKKVDVSKNTKLAVFHCNGNLFPICIKVNENQLNSMPSGWRNTGSVSYNLNCD